MKTIDVILLLLLAAVLAGLLQHCENRNTHNQIVFKACIQRGADYADCTTLEKQYMEGQP